MKRLAEWGVFHDTMCTSGIVVSHLMNKGTCDDKRAWQVQWKHFSQYSYRPVFGAGWSNNSVTWVKGSEGDRQGEESWEERWEGWIFVSPRCSLFGYIHSNNG